MPYCGHISKIVLSSRIGNFKTHKNRRTRIPRWLGQENEENVARTKNCSGWPFSPPQTNEVSLENYGSMRKKTVDYEDNNWSNLRLFYVGVNQTI